MVNEEKLIKTFLELVRIDSPSGEEADVARYIRDRLDKLGFDSEIDDIGNLFCRIDGRGDSVLLSCHMDTVEPGRGIDPVVEKGIIRSSGDTILGADNKVAVSAILETLTHLNEGHRSLEIVFSVREETAGGINYFDHSKLRSKIGILPDKASPVGTIVTASPKIVDIKISIRGKSAHAALPDKGINALVPAIEALSKVDIGKVDKDTSVNFGTISGGNARNSVPGYVNIGGEVRGYGDSAVDAYADKIGSLFRSKVDEIGATLNFKATQAFNAYVYKQDDPSITRIVKAMAVCDIKPEFVRSFGGSDANTFVENGIRVVNVGDGSKDAHTVGESISVEELMRLAKLLDTYVHMD